MIITQGFDYKGIIGAENEVSEIIPNSDWTQYVYKVQFDLNGTGITFNKNLVISSGFYFYQKQTLPIFSAFDQSNRFSVDSPALQYIASKNLYPRLEENYNGELWGVLQLERDSGDPGVTFKQYPSSSFTKLNKNYRLDIPKTFLFFTLNATPELSIDKLTSSLYRTYSFILEPVKLALLPVKISSNLNNGWSVTTSACLRKPKFYPFESYNSATSAYNLIDYERERDLRKNNLESYEYIDNRPFVVKRQFLTSDFEIEAKIPKDLYVRIPKTIYEQYYFVEYELAGYVNKVCQQIVSPTEFNSNPAALYTKDFFFIDTSRNSLAAWAFLVDGAGHYASPNSYLKPKLEMGSVKLSYDIKYRYVNWQTEEPESSYIREEYSPSINGKNVWEQGIGAHNNGFNVTPIIYTDFDSQNQRFIQRHQLLQFKESTSQSDLGDFANAVVYTMVVPEENICTFGRKATTTEFLAISCEPQGNGIEISYESNIFYYAEDAVDVSTVTPLSFAWLVNWAREVGDPQRGFVDNSLYPSWAWADPDVESCDPSKPDTSCFGFDVSYVENPITEQDWALHGHYIRHANFTPVQFRSDGVDTNNCGPVVLQWNTPKPPHTYSYNIRIINDEDRLIDTSALKFQIKSTILKKAAKEVWIENYIATPHHHIHYPLTSEWTCEDDYIKYSLFLDKGYILNDFADNIKITVGPKPDINDDVLNFDTEYDISNSPYLPAKDACCLKVTYKNPILGRFRFGIKTTLKTAVGVQESIEPVMIEFAGNLQDRVNPATPIFLETEEETGTYIKVSAEHLTNIASWPNRDLNNSRISWNAYDKDKNPYIKGEGPKIYIKNSLKEELLSSGELVAFNSDTWTVYMSGYNEGDIISLYSERYNEEAFVKTNPLLTIPSRDFKDLFVIEEVQSELNSYNRKIIVTPRFKQDDLNWSMLENDSLYWDWSYDGKPSTANIPVSAYDSTGQIYTAETVTKYPMTSALELRFEPPISADDFPILHNLEIKCVAVTQHGRLQALRTYEVEEFPPDIHFNSRMQVSYHASSIFGDDPDNIEGQMIADSFTNSTRNLQITRKDVGNNILNQYLIHVDLPTLRGAGITNYSVNFKANDVLQEWQQYETDKNYNTEVFDEINFMSGTLLNSLGNIKSMQFILRLENQPPGWSKIYYKDFIINFDIVNPNFFNEVRFISYPHISWFPWTDNIYVLNNTEFDENYYSNWSYGPTALYSHDDTVGFYFAMCANNNLFANYTYTMVDKENNDLFTVNTPSHCPFSNNLIHIPSLPKIVEEMFTPEGMKVKLRVSNNYFPADMPLQQKVLNSNGELETIYFPLTAETTDANAENFYPDIITGPGPTGPWANMDPADPLYNHPYMASLQLREYEDALNYQFVFFTHDPVVNLAYQNTIRIWQSIGMLEQTPLSILKLKNLNDDVLYTVTYLVSTVNWTDTVTIPFTSLENPDYVIYQLQIGDGSQVGYIDINDIYTPFVVKALSYDLQIGLSDSVLAELHAPWQNYRGIYNPLPDYLSHRVFKTGDPESVTYNLTVKNVAAPSNIYVSTYHTLINNQINFEVQVPPRETTYQVIINYGDGAQDTISLPNSESYTTKRTHSYDKEGTYYISYTAIDQQDNDFLNDKKTLSTPIKIYKEYNKKAYNSLRVYGEEKLKLPYSLDEILIKPNEFVEANVLNKSIENVLKNLEYLKDSTILTPNTTPTHHYGWLGVNSLTKKTGLKWWHRAEDNDYYYKPYLSTDYLESFNDIKDFIEINGILIVLKADQISFYRNQHYPVKLTLINEPEIFANMVNCVGLAEKDGILYIVDSLLNKITSYQLTFTNDTVSMEQINTVGGYGSLDELTKFDTSTEIFISENKIYVLDYFNKAVKQFSLQLIWQKTYYLDEFELDPPSNFSVYKNGDVYILSQAGNIYVLNKDGELKLIHQGTSTNITFKKIFFDNDYGNYLYVATDQHILKFDVDTYTYISSFSLNEYKYPSNRELEFVTARSSKDNSILIVLKNCIIKSHDFFEIQKLTNQMPLKYWSYDDIKIKPNELVNNIAYNRVYLALAQNIKYFRDSIYSKINLVRENTDAGVIRYYNINLIKTGEEINLPETIEQETIYINDTEFNIPQVVNRPLIDLYKSLESILDALQIKDLNIDLYKCEGLFCWSWKQLSCFGEISLPAVQQCGFNPITYEELKNKNMLQEYTYAPSNQWDQAHGECCDQQKYLSPLNYVF